MPENLLCYRDTRPESDLFNKAQILVSSRIESIFNPQKNNVVVVDKTGNFVSGWKLDPQTKKYDNVMDNEI
ncbi:hypothetical protein JK229_17845 [Pantoea dispersa]|nr:colicin D domain-containing protein [Pantoea dispersa]MBS0906988.1 hypothetical protein [Pantoea dispersa]